MKKFVCKVCGYVYEGENPPEFCPQCKAPASSFAEAVENASYATEHVVGIAKGVDPEIYEKIKKFCSVFRFYQYLISIIENRTMEYDHKGVLFVAENLPFYFVG